MKRAAVFLVIVLGVLSGSPGVAVVVDDVDRTDHPDGVRHPGVC